MCLHKEIELISRIENYRGHRSINLYMCRDCKEILVMQDGMTPAKLNGEFREKREAKKLAFAS